MAKYRKKPVTVDAWRYGFETGVLPDWVDDALKHSAVVRTDSIEAYPPLKILTPEGIMTCKMGDWLMKGVEGEIYPCKDSIFKATYEKVEE